MTLKKSDINRPDKRIGATMQTLAYLFDVSLSQVSKAIAAGNIKPSTAVFGVKLYHVESVERAAFGLCETRAGGSPSPEPANDPGMEGVERLADARKAAKGRRNAAQ